MGKTALMAHGIWRPSLDFFKWSLMITSIMKRRRSWRGELLFLLCLFLVFFFFFPKGHPLGKLKLPGLGSNRSCSAWPIPQPQSHRIRATHVTYATTFSNTGSFNPLKEARDQAHILIDISWVVNLLSHNGNSGTVIS